MTIRTITVDDYLEELQLLEQAYVPDLVVGVDSEVLFTPGGRWAGLAFEYNAESASGILTPWARRQLLTLMDTKEGWFSGVTPGTEAAELNARLERLRGKHLRLESLDDNAYSVRGLVSKRYQAISDVRVVGAVAGYKTDMRVIRSMSGKTDTTMYAYLVSGNGHRVTSRVTAYGGVLVRNSEVGYTSVWVTPFVLWVEEKSGRAFPLLSAKDTTLRKSHLGHNTDLAEDIQGALARSATLWRDQYDQLLKLRSISYATTDLAKKAFEAAARRAHIPTRVTNLVLPHFGAPKADWTGYELLKLLLTAYDGVGGDQLYSAGTATAAFTLAL